MANLALVTIENAIQKGVPRANGRPYKQAFWQSFDVQSRSNEYNTIKEARTIEIQSLISGYTTNERIVAKVTVRSNSASKTSIPEEVFHTSNIETLATPQENLLVLSGLKSDFEELKNQFEQANLAQAKIIDSKKKTRIAREIFEVSSITDFGSTYEERLDAAIKENAETDIILIKVFLYPDIPDDTTTEYLQKFTVKLDDDETLDIYDERTFVGKVHVKTIKEILNQSDFKLIQYVEKGNPIDSQRAVQKNHLNSAILTPPLTNVEVTLFDSGIESRFITPVVTKQKSFYPSHIPPRTNHGTFVASRLLYGHNISTLVVAPNSSITPICKINDVKVYTPDEYEDAREELDTINNLIKYLEEIVVKHRDSIYIINMCINTRHYKNGPFINKFTSEVDRIQRENDVLIFISAGNSQEFASCPPQPYSYLFSNSNRITAPGDSINAITVGSITDIADPNALSSKTHLASPFSRRGGIRKYYWEKKPDFVNYGGNVKKDTANPPEYSDSFMKESKAHYGVEGIEGDELHRDIGTSFSTPLVTRSGVEIADYLQRAGYFTSQPHRSNVLKALLIHSSRNSIKELAFPKSVRKNDIKYFYGFGIPNPTTLTSPSNSISLVIADEFTQDKKLHLLSIKIPNSFVGKGANIYFTHVFNPSTNSETPDQYADFYINSTIKFKGQSEPISFGNSLINHSNKYSNTKNVSKLNCVINSEELVLRMEIHERRRVISAQAYPQRYAIVLTLETDDDQFLDQMITLNNMISIQTRVPITVS